MRQIKFRGRTLPNTWFYGKLVQIYDDCRIQFKDSIIDVNSGKTIEYYRSVSVAPSTVGQFTGLHDRNGKEIYEGDVVDVITFFTTPRDKEMGRTRAVIEFDKDQASFIAKARSTTFAMTCANNMEIIGNIHDNPEQIRQRTIKNRRNNER